MVSIDRDRLISAQNASTAAAHIYAAIANPSVGWDSALFEQIRTDIFESSLMLGEVSKGSAPVQPAPAVAPVAAAVTAQAVEQAFPGTTNVTGSPEAAGIQLKNAPFGPLPDWLPSQLAASKCQPGEPLWDNRADLPQNGGSKNPKSPHFKGAISGAGVWPPKGVAA